MKRILLALLLLSIPVATEAAIRVTVLSADDAAEARQAGIRVRVVPGLPPAAASGESSPVESVAEPQQVPPPTPPAAASFIPEVRLYTATWCAACQTQKKILDAAGIDYVPYRGDNLSGGIPQVWISTADGQWKFWRGVVSADAITAEIDRQQSASLDAGQQPTSHDEVDRVLRLLAPRPHETFVDYGCGDGRWVIAAAKKYGCRAVGVEIDPQRAAVARQNVQAAGVGHLVEIIEGDATQVNVDADVGVAYLWPEVLNTLKPKLTRLDRFVSYMHPVSGLQMTERDGAYLWRNGQSVASSVSRPAPQRTAVWGGRRYAAPVCSNPRCQMCASIRAQLAGVR